MRPRPAWWPDRELPVRGRPHHRAPFAVAGQPAIRRRHPGDGSGHEGSPCRSARHDVAGRRRLQPAARPAAGPRARKRRYDDLREALRDRWHQPARASLVPGLREALAIDDPAVLGVCLSGSGPSIVALARPGSRHEAAAALSAVYRRISLPRDHPRTWRRISRLPRPAHSTSSNERTLHELQSPLPSVSGVFPRRPRSGSATNAWARSRSPTTTTAIGQAPQPRRPSSRVPRASGATASCCRSKASRARASTPASRRS